MNQKGKYIEQPMSRVDGPLKVTGKARYAAEFSVRNVAYGFPVPSTIAAGRVGDIDTSAAEKAPGVIKIITHKNAARLAPREEPVTPQNRTIRSVPVLQDTRIHQFGQYIGVVIAETYEQARYAARLVKVTYDEARP